MSRLTVKNDWMVLTYYWDGLQVDTVRAIFTGEKQQKKVFSARFRMVDRSYSDHGIVQWTRTNIIEVHIPEIDQWVELTNLKMVTELAR